MNIASEMLVKGQVFKISARQSIESKAKDAQPVEKSSPSQRAYDELSSKGIDMTSVNGKEYMSAVNSLIFNGVISLDEGMTFVSALSSFRIYNGYFENYEDTKFNALDMIFNQISVMTDMGSNLDRSKIDVLKRGLSSWTGVGLDV